MQIVDIFKLLTLFEKNYIIDVQQGQKYASVYGLLTLANATTGFFFLAKFAANTEQRYI